MRRSSTCAGVSACDTAPVAPSSARSASSQLPLLAQDLGGAQPRLEEARVALVHAHVGRDRAGLVLLAPARPRPAAGRGARRRDPASRPARPARRARSGRLTVRSKGSPPPACRRRRRRRSTDPPAPAPRPPRRAAPASRRTRRRPAIGAVRRGRWRRGSWPCAAGDLVGRDLQLAEQDARLDVVRLELDRAGQRRRRLIERARSPRRAPRAAPARAACRATRRPAGARCRARAGRSSATTCASASSRCARSIASGVVVLERERRGLAQRRDRLRAVRVVAVRLGEMRPGQVALDGRRDLERARDLFGRVVEPPEPHEQLRQVRRAPRRRRDRTAARAAARRPPPSSAPPPRRATRARRARTPPG